MCSSTDRNLYTIRAVSLAEIRSIRRHTPPLGWQYIIIVLTSGMFLVGLSGYFGLFCLVFASFHNNPNMNIVYVSGCLKPSAAILLFHLDFGGLGAGGDCCFLCLNSKAICLPSLYLLLIVCRPGISPSLLQQWWCARVSCHFEISCNSSEVSNKNCSCTSHDILVAHSVSFHFKIRGIPTHMKGLVNTSFCS